MYFDVLVRAVRSLGIVYRRYTCWIVKPWVLEEIIFSNRFLAYLLIWVIVHGDATFIEHRWDWMLPLIDNLDVECKFVRFTIKGKFANIGRSIFICTNISLRSIIWMSRRGCINLIMIGGSLWNSLWNCVQRMRTVVKAIKIGISLWIFKCNSLWIRVQRMRTVMKAIKSGILDYLLVGLISRVRLDDICKRGKDRIIICIIVNIEKKILAHCSVRGWSGGKEMDRSKFVVKNHMELWRYLPCFGIQHQWNLRRVNIREPKEKTETRARIPFWYFLAIL